MIVASPPLIIWLAGIAIFSMSARIENEKGKEVIIVLWPLVLLLICMIYPIFKVLRLIELIAADVKKELDVFLKEMNAKPTEEIE